VPGAACIRRPRHQGEPCIAGRAFAIIAEAQMPRTVTGKIQHRWLREHMLASQGIEQA
jgi:acyl-coenzyme A synthetase/AMP-(fatty) acid ligase